jgi:hypothetical protein
VTSNGCCRLESMSKATSPYYPPRARWYAPLLRMGGAVQRTAVGRITLPSTVTWSGLTLSLLFPGMGFYLRAPRIVGLTAIIGCAALLFCFVAWFGYPIANFAFGLLVSIHTSGFVYYCDPFLRAWEFGPRILFTGLVLVGLGCSIYLPLRNTIQNDWLMPLRINGNIVVVQRIVSAQDIKHGDWIAYRLTGASESFYEEDLRISARGGVGLGPVLGVAGDQVVFSNDVVSVNGVTRPLMPFMPRSGTVTVPDGCWFIWPGYSIRGRGDSGRITSLMLSLANVPYKAYFGRPLKRWFWRTQTLQ